MLGKGVAWGDVNPKVSGMNTPHDWVIILSLDRCAVISRKGRRAALYSQARAWRCAIKCAALRCHSIQIARRCAVLVLNSWAHNYQMHSSLFAGKSARVNPIYIYIYTEREREREINIQIYI